MSVELRFAFSLGLIFLSTFLGYFMRKRKLLPEAAAGRIMTLVAVVGYPVVGFMAIWQISLQWTDMWLPFLGMVQATITALFALWVGRKIFPDYAERGLVGISCGIGNHGVTMAGFVVYLLFGDEGLGLNIIYAMYTFFALVLLSYTIAQVYAENVQRKPIMRLMLENLVHWRAVGLYACLGAILLTSFNVPAPEAIKAFHLLDISIYAVIAFAYFSIGLRLHLPHILELKKAIFSVLFIRHIVSLAVGCLLLGVTFLTPWPLHGLALKVFIIQSSVSVGVMGVAVANMFDLKPEEASAIFVVSSLVYLLGGIPLVLWLFG
ncbi:MAG: hypothetical protein KAI74_00845 [Kiritimatiellae bacterium]|nr:hypothetical protein [Kiritimatiellia bacterium]